MLQFEANLAFLRCSCRELYVVEGRRQRRRTKIKWWNFGAYLLLHINGNVSQSARSMCILVLSLMIICEQASKGNASLLF